MAKDPFVLVSLEESESKALAQVISNDTARKILDYLSKHESATESKVAGDLKLALSTVHYNLQALTKANLVQAEEFHYSEKGKEVLHYSLANKVIIIAPKRASTESFRDKLKNLFPAFVLSIAGAAIIQIYTAYFSKPSAEVLVEAPAMAAKVMSADVSGAAAGASEPVAELFALQAAPSVQQTVVNDFTLALVFLSGSIIAILGVVAWDYYKGKRKQLQQ